MDDTHDILAAILQRTDSYRVLRRVPMPPMGASPPGMGLATAIIIDTETTGLDPATDEVIELAMVKLEFDPHTAEVHQVSGLFTGLRDPNRAIPPEIVRLTRLTDEAVAGRTIDPADVERFVAGAVMVIAHNSAFDRPFVERVWPIFATLPWACSLTQVDWRSEGAEGSKLGHLLMAKGFFFDGHRALDDCLALVHLLGLPLGSGDTTFRTMMLAATTPGIRLWAVDAPFRAKDCLKARRYRWSDGSAGPRAWNREVDEGGEADEIAFLREHVYADPAASPLRVPVTAWERFSARAGIPGPAGLAALMGNPA